MMERTELQQLEHLLKRRLEVIADHAWRDRDAAAHLKALQSVSEEIDAEVNRLGRTPGRLNHFLQQRSYEKALAWIEAL